MSTILLAATMSTAFAAAAADDLQSLPIRPIEYRRAKPLKVEPVGITGMRPWIRSVDSFPIPGSAGMRHLLYYKKEGKNERQCWFVSLDMATGQMKKHAGMPGLEVLPHLWLDGKLYLGMNLPGHVLVYDPATDDIADLGNAYEKSASIFKMAAAPDGTIACGGISPTEVSLYDTRTRSFTRYGTASTGNHGYVYSIGQDNDFIYAACRGKDPWHLVAIDKKTKQKKLLLTAPTDAWMEARGATVSVSAGSERKVYSLDGGQLQPHTPAPAKPQPAMVKPKVVFDEGPLLEGRKELAIHYQNPARLDEWKTVALEVPLAGKALTAACSMTKNRLAAMGSAYHPIVVFDAKTGEGRQAPMGDVSSRCMLAIGDIVYVTGYPGTVTMAWDTTRPSTRPDDVPGRKGIPMDDPRANPRVLARYPMGISSGGHIGVQMFPAADGHLYIVARRHRHHRGFDIVWHHPASGKKGEIDDHGILDHLQIGWATLVDGATKLAIATTIEPNDQVQSPMPDSARLVVLDLASRTYAAQHTPFPGVKTLIGIAEAGPNKLVGLAVANDQKTGYVYRFDLKQGQVDEVVRYDSYMQGLPSVTGLPGAGYDFVLGPDGKVWTGMSIAAEMSAVLRIDPKDLTVEAIGTARGSGLRYIFHEGDLYLTGDTRLRRVVGGPVAAGRQSQATAVNSKKQTAWQKIVVDLGNDVKLELVLIPAGEFLMDSAASDTDTSLTVKRVQQPMRITQPFYLGKHEVTQEQWQTVMGNNPSWSKGPKKPVEQVSWDDCQTFLVKLNAKTARQEGTFALPTEAQWEYACRAGSTTRFCFGDDQGLMGEYAWYLRNSRGETHPVGEKRPNAWGLYDMHGNVHEWCADGSVRRQFIFILPEADSMGPSGARAMFRVTRGGAWCNDAPTCSSAYRSHSPAGDRWEFGGFRVCVNPATPNLGQVPSQIAGASQPTPATPSSSHIEGPRYATPEEALAAFRSGDPKRFLGALTPQSQDMLVGMAAVATWYSSQEIPELAEVLRKHQIAFQDLLLDLNTEELPPSWGHDKEGTGDLDMMDERFERVDQRMREWQERVGKSIRDKSGFLNAVAERLDKMVLETTSKTGFDVNSLRKGYPEAELHGLTIEGNTAFAHLSQRRGKDVIERPLVFERIEGGWRLRFCRVEEMPQAVWMLAAMTRSMLPRPNDARAEGRNSKPESQNRDR